MLRLNPALLAALLSLPAPAGAQSLRVKIAPLGPSLVLPVGPMVLAPFASGAGPITAGTAKGLASSLPSLSLPAVHGVRFAPATVVHASAKAPAASENVPVMDSARSLMRKPAASGAPVEPGKFAAVYDGSARSRPATVDARRSLSGESAAFAQRDYLSETDGKTGHELVDALNRVTGRGAKIKSYDEARYYLFSKADNVLRGGVRGVVAAYSQIFVAGTSGDGGDYREDGDANGDGHDDMKGMNVEHLWPQSFFNSKRPMRADLHHLLPVFVHPNSVRSRFPIGEVKDSDAEYRNRAGAKLGKGVFEPPDAVKGRVARGLLYFFVRYHTRHILPGGRMQRFWNSRIETYLRWNREFPPDDEERARNDRVEAYQKNRNPFVDDPALADRIGAEAFRLEIKEGQSYATRPIVRVSKKEHDKKKRGQKKREGRRQRRGFRR